MAETNHNAQPVAEMAQVEVGDANPFTPYEATVVTMASVTPTQVRRPWRSTVRTIFQALVAFSLLWPLIVQALGLPDWAWVAIASAVAGGIARVMALPQVEAFLRRFLPFLSAAPNQK